MLEVKHLASESSKFPGLTSPFYQHKLSCRSFTEKNLSKKIAFTNKAQQLGNNYAKKPMVHSKVFKFKLIHNHKLHGMFSDISSRLLVK